MYEDIISYSFINMSYNEIDSIVRDVNVSAADRAIGINVRDFSGAYLLQENHTALYYAIFLIKKFLNENILTKHEIQDLSQELAKIVNPKNITVIFVEEEIRAGGFGMMLSDALIRRGSMRDRPYAILATDDSFVSQDKPEPIFRTAGVDAEAMVTAIGALLQSN